MLKIVVLLIVAVQLQVVTSSGGGALDYEKQGEWGGDCNKKGSMKQSPVNVIIPKESTAATGKLVKLSGTIHQYFWIIYVKKSDSQYL